MNIALQSEEQLEDCLFDSWWDLRAEGLSHLGAWPTGTGAAVGLKRALTRQVPLPSSSRGLVNTGYADFVEIEALAVQAEGGQWSPLWRVLVVELKLTPVKLGDISQVMRYRGSIEAAFHTPGHREVIAQVQCAIIAPYFPPHVRMVADSIPGLDCCSFETDHALGLLFDDCDPSSDQLVSIATDPGAASLVTDGFLERISTPVAPHRAS